MMYCDGRRLVLQEGRPSRDSYLFITGSGARPKGEVLCVRMGEGFLVETGVEFPTLSAVERLQQFYIV